MKPIKLELKQHNLAPTKVETIFGEGVQNDDGTCLYSVDKYNINLIHCITMEPNGKVKHELIKNTNINIKPQIYLEKISPLLFHNNSIWLYGTTSNNCNKDNITLKNELWLFDLNKHQWEKKEIKFNKSSIDINNDKSMPSINAKAKKERNIDLPFPCGRSGHLFAKISSKYAIISNGDYDVNDCYSLNLETLECLYLFDSKRNFGCLYTIPQSIANTCIIAFFHCYSSDYCGWYCLDTKLLIKKIESIETAIANKNKNRNIDCDSNDSDDINVDVDFNLMCFSLFDDDHDKYNYAFGNIDYNSDSNINSNDSSSRDEYTVSAIKYGNSIYECEASTSFGLFTSNTEIGLYKSVIHIDHDIINVDDIDNDDTEKVVYLEQKAGYPKSVQFWTKNEVLFDDNEKNNVEKKLDRHLSDEIEKAKMCSYTQFENENLIKQERLRLNNIIDNLKDIPLNWKRYHYYWQQFVNYSGICDPVVPVYHGYKMKYGYIWICKYCNGLNNGIFIPNYYYKGNNHEKRIKKKLLKWCIFSLNTYYSLEWKIERLLWIAHYKYNEKCNMSHLPKDIVKKIIVLLHTSIYTKIDM